MHESTHSPSAPKLHYDVRRPFSWEKLRELTCVIFRTFLWFQIVHWRLKHYHFFLLQAWWWMCLDWAKRDIRTSLSCIPIATEWQVRWDVTSLLCSLLLMYLLESCFGVRNVVSIWHRAHLRHYLTLLPSFRHFSSILLFIALQLCLTIHVHPYPVLSSIYLLHTLSDTIYPHSLPISLPLSGTVGLMTLPILGAAEGYTEEQASEPAIALGEHLIHWCSI